MTCLIQGLNKVTFFITDYVRKTRLRVMLMKLSFQKNVTFLRIPTWGDDKISVYKTSIVTRRRIGIQDSGLQFHFFNH